ncbi:MAG TPA: molybdate ABC transporter substrate-binding protein, partial [Pseudonocardiaceae bacterium]|nr:molybdate ABC transporter substrate-binding protein [Pseudonocardiaceae bacterium]
MFRTRSALTAAVLAFVLTGLAILPQAPPPAAAAPASQGATLTVFAAASLTDAFKEIGGIFEANSGTPVTFNFGASTQLRTQLEQGAVADVFGSADQAQMDRAREA